MKRFLIAGAGLLTAAVLFSGFGTGVSVADTGFDNLGPNYVGSDAPPVVAGQSSIDHVPCFGDGGNAIWKKTNLTFTIQGGEQFSYEASQAIANGALEWNKVGAATTLTRTGYAGADIGIIIYPTVAPLFGSGVLAATFTDCFVSSEGIYSATIYIGVSITSGLPNLNVLQNVAAHEVGHALGLGHANNSADLMSPTTSPTSAARIVCPSSLDVAALTSRSPIVSMANSAVREVPCI